MGIIVERIHKKSNNNDTLDLNWTVDGPANKRWSDFRDVVRSHIVEEENNQLNFIQYMFLHECTYG